MVLNEHNNDCIQAIHTCMHSWKCLLYLTLLSLCKFYILWITLVFIKVVLNNYKNYKFIQNNFYTRVIQNYSKYIFYTSTQIIQNNVTFANNLLLVFYQLLSSLLDLVLSSVLGGADTDTGGTLCWFMRWGGMTSIIRFWHLGIFGWFVSWQDWCVWNIWLRWSWMESYISMV